MHQINFLESSSCLFCTGSTPTRIRSSQLGTTPIRSFGYSPTCPAKFPVERTPFGGLTVTRTAQISLGLAAQPCPTRFLLLRLPVAGGTEGSQQLSTSRAKVQSSSGRAGPRFSEQGLSAHLLCNQSIWLLRGLILSPLNLRPNQLLD